MKDKEEKTYLDKTHMNSFLLSRFDRNYTPLEPSEDTKIRRTIYYTILDMAKLDRSSIEIKSVLVDKYPNYEEYIVKMINQFFSKKNSRKVSKTSAEEKGEER